MYTINWLVFLANILCTGLKVPTTKHLRLIFRRLCATGATSATAARTSMCLSQRSARLINNTFDCFTVLSRSFTCAGLPCATRPIGWSCEDW